VGNESYPACLADAFQQPLQIVSQGRQLPVSAKYQKVVFLRVMRLVMDLLSYQHQDLPVAVSIIVFRTFDQHIMVSDDDCIQAGFQRRSSDGVVVDVPIRVKGVHVEIDDDLVHVFDDSTNERYNPPAKIKFCTSLWRLKWRFIWISL
jgi:hypothetical protein